MHSLMTDRILLVQLADVGDLVLTTPAIASLRASRPDAHLTLLTSRHVGPVVDPTLVDEIITLDKRSFNGTSAFFRPGNIRRLRQLRGHFDVIVFFHHFTLKLGTLKFALMRWIIGAPRVLGIDNGNGWFLNESIADEGYGWKHQAQYWLDLVALLEADSAPERAHVAFDQGVLPLPAYQGRRIVIHAGSGGYSRARRWEPEKFARVADALQQKHNAQIVLVGTADDDAPAVRAAMQSEAVDLTGRTTLTQLTDLIRSADLYIGADSGVMHLAAAVRTPVIAIFGPSNHTAWGPWSPGGQSVVLRSDVLCSPCSYIGHQIGAREGCEARTCMRLITADDVLQAAHAMLAGEAVTVTKREMAQPSTNRVQILGMPVDRITTDGWMNQLAGWIKAGDRAHQVCTINPEFIMIAQNDPIFRVILQRADLCIPDGVGLLWAARVLGKPLIERVTGSDGTIRIAKEAAHHGWRLFFLGAAPGIAEQAARKLREQFPELQIVGTYAGSPSPEEEDSIVERVNASDADILLVAYGAPKQDKWIARNLPRLQVSMAMGVGGSFDFIAGAVPRAPLWMREYGLEWLYRLIKQPWRIKRMLRLPRFVLAVLLRGERSA